MHSLAAVRGLELLIVTLNVIKMHFKPTTGRFRTKMRLAQEHVRKVLDTARSPTIAASCPHTYNDK